MAYEKIVLYIQRKKIQTGVNLYTKIRTQCDQNKASYGHCPSVKAQRL